MWSVMVKNWWRMVFTPDKKIDRLLREKNYLQKLGLHLDIYPTYSWFILILALNNE